MATIDQLRKLFGGTSDEDTVLTASQKLGISVTDIADEVGVPLGGQWGNRFSGSVDSYQAGLYDVGSAVTGAIGMPGASSWLDQRRQLNQRQADFSRQAAREQGAVMSYKDVGGVGDALNYLGGLAVDSAPYLGEALVGGLAARGAMVGTRAAMGAAREMGMTEAAAAAGRSLGRGSTAGAVAASYPSSVGDILGNQREEAGRTDLGSAALYGVPYAAANAFGLEGAAARAQMFRPAVSWFDNAAGVRGGLKRAGVTALGTGLQEGAGETFQEVMNQAGRNAVNPNAGYFGPEATDRYVESFIGGGLLGGVMGGAGGGWRRSAGYKPPIPVDPGQSTDLLQTETTLTTDAGGPAGFGQRVAARWNGASESDQAAVAQRQAELEAWLNAPSGQFTSDPVTGQERPLSNGELYDIRSRVVTPGEAARPLSIGWNGVATEPILGLPNGQGVPGQQFDGMDPVVQSYLTSQGPFNPEQNLLAASRAAGARAVSSPQAIEQQLGLRMPGSSPVPRADLEAAFNEPSGTNVSGPENYLERPLDMGQLNAVRTGDYAGQLRQAEQTRAKAAELQAKTVEAEKRHAARRQAAVDGLLDPSPEGLKPTQLRQREIDTFATLQELQQAGRIDDATYVDMVGRMRDALQNGSAGQAYGDHKTLNAVAKEAAALKEQADAASTGTNGAAGAADLGRSAGDQRAPGQSGGVRPAQPGTAAQGVVRTGTDELGPRGVGGDAALSQPVIGAGARNAVARVEQITGLTLNPAQRKLVNKLTSATPRTVQMLQDMLGLDAEWHQTGTPMSVRDVGAKYGVSGAAVHKALKKLGIQAEQVQAATAAAPGQTVSGSELLANADDGGPTGFRVSDQVNAGADDFELDARTQRDQKATDAFLKDNDGQTAGTLVDPAKAQREVEIEQRNKERAVRGLIAWLDDPANASNVQKSGVDWDDAKSDNHLSYNELPLAVRALWARDYLAQLEETGNEWDPIQQAFDEFVAARSDQVTRGQDSRGVEGGRGARLADGAGRDGAGVRPSGQEAEGTRGDESWGNQLEKSRTKEQDADAVYYDRDSLEDDLLAFMNADSLGRHVEIVEDASELTHPDDAAAAMDPEAQAWVRGNKAVLIANRIRAGRARSVFLHEVGSHLGLQRLLGAKEFDALTSKIIGWASRGGNSVESRIARRAADRVNAAGETDPQQRMNELVAYFVEEASNEGVDPTATKYDGELNRWMRRLWAAFKVALRKLGVNPDKLNAQDVVDLAYGAARLNVSGRFHGTAAKVRQFRTKYIGTGEGAQSYGWGLYFSEMKGVADGYKRTDVKRKQMAGAAVTYDGKQSRVATALAKAYGWGIDNYGAKWAVDRLLSDYESQLSVEETGWAIKRLEQDIAALKVMDPAKLDFGRGGTTYATDIAVRDDELLDWVRPLAEQPDVVQDMIRRYVPREGFKESGHADSGGGLYHYLEDRARSLVQMLPPGTFKDREDVGADEAVSRWLDSIGVKGVKMPVNYQRGGSYEGGRNFVVFNEKNVIRTMTNPENRVSRSVQFSKTPTAEAVAKVTEALPQPAKNAWTDVKDWTARKLPYVMTTFQIFEQFGAKLPKLWEMIHANDLMRQEAISLQMQVDEIVKRWDKLPKAAGELLSKVAQRATLLGAYPDKAWDSKDNAHVDRDRKAEYDELVKLYNQMKATSPQALKVYEDALAAFEAQRQQLETAAKQMFEKYGKVMPAVKRVPGPYFPLVRRGDYLAIGESPRLRGLKDQLEKAQEANAPEDQLEDLRQSIDQLEADGQSFWVSSHETRSAMEQALRDYESRGLKARASLASQRLDGLPTRNLHSTIANLTAEATKNLSKDGAKEVGNALAEILLRSLPEGHALERQAARRGVAGAMDDMKRAVAIAGRQNAYYIARLNHAKEAADALAEMGRSVKGDVDLQHVHRELEQRHALNLQWHETPFQDAIGKAAWTWFLGASPTFLLMNMAQPWLISAPVMAGKYGAGAASRELARGTRDAFAALKKARWVNGKLDLWSGIDTESVEGRHMVRNAEGRMIAEDRKALRELIQRGVIDEGLAPELAMYAESGGTGMLTKLSRLMGWPAQQVELVNRVSTGLAAFRLERAKRGPAGETAEQAYQRAVDAAYATVVNTHVDYGAENAPRAMREGGGIPLAKLVFQFRRYQQAMFYLLAANVKKLRDPAEQKAARATLAYLALTSAMSAGAIGLPFMGTAMLLADLFGDDDDEEGDAKTRLRNALRDMTGSKEFADVLAKGLPAMFGVDIAERVGLGQVGQLFPRLDLSRSRTAEDKMGKALVALAGPAGGLGTQALDAASYFGAGDFLRGTERLLPKMFADPVRAMREQARGMEDRKGEQVMSSEELTLWDTTRRLLGASSIAETDRFEATKAVQDVERGMSARRDRIHAEFRRALRSGDFADVREMITEFNADHPRQPIKPKDEQAWRKEAARASAQRDPETGIKLTKRQQPLADLQRFAQ